jgi:dTDP-4-dehydrorhamnose reductase
MTVLVTGCTGILGRAVVDHGLEQGVPVVATFHERPAPGGVAGEGALRLDITRERDVFAVLDSVRPRTVINCAGLTKALCDDVARAWLVNAVGPRIVSAAAERSGARLIHVSTDCVFSGDRGPYDERSTPDARDTYGRSKLAGETCEPPHLTVRTSFIGNESGTRNGLLAWFLSQEGRATGFTNHLWSGLTAPALARLLLTLADRPDVSGLVHLHGEDTSKARLLYLLKHAYGSDVEIVDDEAESDVDRRLRSTRMNDLGLSVPPLAEMIDDLAQATARVAAVGRR